MSFIYRNETDSILLVISVQTALNRELPTVRQYVHVCFLLRYMPKGANIHRCNMRFLSANSLDKLKLSEILVKILKN